MWPWEHLAIGYLAYSALTHARERRSPTAGQALAVALGSLFPDLVDKPLAWGFGVLPAGWSLAHSLLTAVPLCALVVAIARRDGRPALGAAFAVGYLLHLPADVLYGVLLGGPPVAWFLAWPLVPAPPHSSGEFLVRIERLARGFVRRLGSPAGQAYLLGEIVLMGGALLVWVRDGRPGLELVRDR